MGNVFGIARASTIPDYAMLRTHISRGGLRSTEHAVFDGGTTALDGSSCVADAAA